MATLYAGTSGFAYPAWKPGFYPAKLPAKQFLTHYAGRLNCGGDQLHLPAAALGCDAGRPGWRPRPPGFVFAVKANQRITHILRLKNARQATELFFKMIDPLRTRAPAGADAVPASAATEVRRGAAAATTWSCCPRDMRYAFEFRHESWLAEPVYEELRRRNVSLCVAESEKLEVPEVITADFVYYRLRKPEYTAEDVAGIARAGAGTAGRRAGTCT